MRISRTLLAAAFSAAAALAAVSVAHAQPAPAATASQFSDADVRAYAKALTKVSDMSKALNGAQPTEAQRTDMVKAITDAGLTVEKFNAIATAAANDTGLKARISIFATPDSPAGSVGASVTDAEAMNYAKAMKGIRAVAVSTPPTAAEQAAQQKAVTDAGLTIERFNAMSQAASTDLHLRARIVLAASQLD